MAPRYILHGAHASPPTYKVALMLALCGEAFAYRHVDMAGGQHRSPAYLRMNRFGQVPVLEDAQSGRFLVQSAAILEYLADRTGKFGGADLDERLRIREWLFWNADRLGPPIVRGRSIARGWRSAPADVVALYAGQGRAALDVLEGALAGAAYIVGEGPSIADIDLYAIASLGESAGYPRAERPGIARWLERIEALPGFGRPRDLLAREDRG